MNVDGGEVGGTTMGWNILYHDLAGGAGYSWSLSVDGFANNHDASNWGELLFVEGYAAPVPSMGKMSTTWCRIKAQH